MVPAAEAVKECSCDSGELKWVGFETLFMMTDFLKGATAAEVKAGPLSFACGSARKTLYITFYTPYAHPL